MTLEIFMATVIVLMFAICAGLLCYDINVHKKKDQLEKELATARRLTTKLYEQDAIAAQEGR